MKFKFLSILMAVAVALAFSSCKNETSGSGSGSASGNEDKNNTEKVEKTNDANEVAEEAPTTSNDVTPTGDIEKDAKVILDKLTSVKTAEDAKNLLEVSSKFDNYYEAKGEEAFQKWSEAGQKAISSDPKLQEAVANLQKLASEAK